jgi:hypothetical protein
MVEGDQGRRRVRRLSEAVEILDVILSDEIGHVAIGNYWYRWLCVREGLELVAHYATLTDHYDAPRMYPPFNEAARKSAGFTDEETGAVGFVIPDLIRDPGIHGLRGWRNEESRRKSISRRVPRAHLAARLCTGWLRRAAQP